MRSFSAAYRPARVFRSDKIYQLGHRLSLSAIGTIGDLLRLHGPVFFCLHSIVREGSDAFAGSMSISDSFLDGLIIDLRRRKVDIVSLSDAISRLQNGLRAPFACLTFDDGYRDNFEIAYPILKRHDAPSTIFLTTGLVDGNVPMWWHPLERTIASVDTLRWGGKNVDIRTESQKQETFANLGACFRSGTVEDNKALLEKLAADNSKMRLADAYECSLTWAMVREMAASGLVEFGCHSVSHAMMSRLDPHSLEQEIAGSRARLRNAANLEANYFAYPFGQPHEVGPLAAHIVEKSGFDAAFTTMANVLTPAALRSPYALPRIMLTRKAQAPAIARAYMSGIPAFLKKVLAGTNSIATQPLRQIAGDKPLFSLIIATVGRACEIVRCLESLSRQTLPHLEVIVVDQNVDGQLDAIVARFAESLRIRHVRAPRGLSRARNVGITHATGLFVGFPDDDCWYPPDLLAQIYSRFLAEPRLDGLTMRCTDGAGRMAAGKHDERPGDVTRANVWERGVGATMFIRRAALREIGGFDENLGLGASTVFQSGEETDLLLRILSHGYLIRYDPSLEVFHPLEDLESPRAALKAWSYGLGMGRVLRLRHYGFSSLFSHVATPAAGAVVACLMNRPSLARVRLARALARFEGWRWTNETKRDLSPPAWVVGRNNSENTHAVSKGELTAHG